MSLTVACQKLSRRATLLGVINSGGTRHMCHKKCAKTINISRAVCRRERTLELRTRWNHGEPQKELAMWASSLGSAQPERGRRCARHARRQLKREQLRGPLPIKLRRQCGNERVPCSCCRMTVVLSGWQTWPPWRPTASGCDLRLPRLDARRRSVCSPMLGVWAQGPVLSQGR